jgi:PIN domain nuclease of toxin-antitoxin system
MAGDRPPLKVLTDTHSLVWALSDPASLNPAARRPDSVVEQIHRQRWHSCSAIRATHVMALGALADIHRDPFDRIVVA